MNKINESKNTINKFCGAYIKFKTVTEATSVAISFGISFINFFIRIMVISTLKKIGFHQESQITTEIVTTIFVLQYINTGLMLIITNANLRNSYSLQYLNGNFTDFTSDWYIEVGSQLIQTMLVAAFMPYLTFVITFTIKMIARL